MTWAMLLGLALAGLAGAIDNGIGLTPPRGWRSWNAFDCLQDKTIITQAHMKAQMDAVLDKSRLVDGKPMSLAELGFDWVSMDDGWQRCNCSVRQDLDPALPKCDGDLCFGGHCSWHDESGTPAVRKDRFPDMKALVDYGHGKGLKVGTYLNNCICNEHGPTHYDQDVKWMVEDMGFDGVKIDSCGNSKNVSHWAELFNKSGKAIRIENCHNGWPDFHSGDCPMNFFRTGGDIGPNMGSILGEVYSTIDAADLQEPRSRPGCWAYPDMSEVGNFAPGPSQVDQERSHWGLWCIVSSPLILGLDMNDSAKMDRVWPTVTNRDALAISEAWAGHPGTLIKSYAASGPELQAVQGECDGSPSTTGWHFKDGQLVAPGTGAEPPCLTMAAAGCPPPTTYSKSAQCGLLLGNCSTAPPSDHWQSVDGMVQLRQGKADPRCLAADASDFDITKGYYTRKPEQVSMAACPKSSTPVQGASADPDVPPQSSPECALADKVRELRIAAGTLSGPGREAPVPSNLLFNLTAKGELRSARGTCLRPAFLSGVQLWAKPLNRSASAALLVNPLPNNQSTAWSLADVPRQFLGQAAADFVCEPGRCTVRDVWAGTDFPVTSAQLNVTLRPWASALFILRSHAETVTVTV